MKERPHLDEVLMWKSFAFLLDDSCPTMKSEVSGQLSTCTLFLSSYIINCAVCVCIACLDKRETSDKSLNGSKPVAALGLWKMWSTDQASIKKFVDKLRSTTFFSKSADNKQANWKLIDNRYTDLTVDAAIGQSKSVKKTHLGCDENQGLAWLNHIKSNPRKLSQLQPTLWQFCDSVTFALAKLSTATAYWQCNTEYWSQYYICNSAEVPTTPAGHRQGSRDFR